MQRLPLKLLEPGMIVAKAVVNEKGIVLVSENTELTDKLISRLENMDVAKVAVKGCPVKLPNYAPKKLKDRLADLETGFSRIEKTDDLMRKFKVLVKAHFIKREKEMNEADPPPPAADFAPAEAQDA